MSAKRRTIAAATVLLSVWVGTARSAILYVDDDAVGGDGSTWQTAYRYLQDALTDARVAQKPVEIRVGRGVYRPDDDALHPAGTGDRTATFQLASGVTVRGGYAGPGRPDPNARDVAAYATILSGDLDGNDTNSAGNAENSYHIVTGTATDETAVLDGFTVTGGNASGLGADGSGGAMFNGPGSSPTVINCTFSRNAAAAHGAGMYNDNDCSPTLTGCTFIDNVAVGYGGGICNGYHCGGTLTACAFKQNMANYGGGMRNTTSSPTLIDCTFSENIANYGAGLNNADGSDAAVMHCTFAGNAARTNAGAMLNSYSSPTIDRCTFLCNSAQGDGAGVYNYFENTEPLITNCVFKGNFAEGDGGAMYNRNDTIVTVRNCLFTGNSSPHGKAVACDSHGGGHRYPNVVRVLNCILWEGGGEIWIGDDSVVWVNYSVVGGGWPGLENRQEDPRLTPDGHLCAESSVCINQGDPAYSPPQGERDLDGEPREHQGIEIGPDEFIDSDWDGLPDWWEQKYFASSTGGNQKDDTDGDGLNNRAEYESSRNPLRGPRNYYINPVAGSDAWDGLASSWDGLHGPKRTIQSAVDAALPYEGDTIILAPGTYAGDGNRDIKFRGKVLTVRSTDPDDPAVVAATVIDCQGSLDDPHRGFDFHYGEGSGSAVRGLTITNGFARVGGGGIACRYASPTVSQNRIAQNTADGDGGGVFVRGGAPVIVENTIKANIADDDGGGISCRDASAVISRNLITENRSPEDNGGGIFCRGAAPTITNNVITGNRAEDGGGIWLRDCSAIVLNNTVAGNVAMDTGGALGCRGDFGTAMPTVMNNILWNNTAVNGSEIALIGGAALVVGYSDVKAGPAAAYVEAGSNLAWAEGNIESDPFFVKPGRWDDNGTPAVPEDDLWVNGDYHLQSEGWRWDGAWRHDDMTSRCVDAGNPCWPLGDEPTILAVDPLLESGCNVRVNMGAYGGTAEASMPPYDWALLADLNNDGTVGFVDFAMLASDMQQTESRRPGDVNRDTAVNTSDLVRLALDWLGRTSWYEP